MPSDAKKIDEQLKRCEQILKTNLKENDEFSAPCKIALPARFERIVHQGYDKEKKPCGCDESDISEESVDSQTNLNCGGERVLGSIDAQIEFLRHELFLTKNQVLERNKQIEKLENLIQHQYAKMKHNCEGSSINMIKLVELMHDAIKLQNSQIENLSNLKTRIFALEGTPSTMHKNGNEDNKRTRDTCCKAKLQTNQNGRVRFADEDSKKEALSEELEKQKTINCQLNENTRRLEEEVRSLKSQLDRLKEEKVSSQKVINSFEIEKRNFEKQIFSLTESNKKLTCNISKIDVERDKIVKELDCSDELIAQLKIQLQNANVQVKNYESQYSGMSERNRKLQELLTNSERIVESLNKQKMELSRELGEANAKFSDLQKSHESIKHKYHQTAKTLKKVKKDFVKANEEKVVLQSQLQEYVSKVRQIEDMLLQKEQEREFLFEQFKELTARDNCKSVMMETNCESPVEDENSMSCSEVEPISKADVVIQTEFSSELPQNIHEELNLEKQAQELQRELTMERKTSDKLHDVIRTTRQEAMEATTKNEFLTEQLEMMAQTVRHLESQVKTIGVSLEKYRKECMDQETHCQRLERDLVRERFHRARSESSRSTML